MQVKASHYGPATYDQRSRWITYWYQIQAVARTRAKSLLEVGCGSGVMSAYLRARMGLEVTTVDLDPELHPDLVADVRSLSRVLQPKSFDAVCAFQVLEHLPFTEFPGALEQIAAVARSHVLLSLPYWGLTLALRVWFKHWQIAAARKITVPFTWHFDGQHYWEVGTRGYPLRRILGEVSRVLTIESRYFCPDYPYHYFLECRVKDTGPS